MRNLSLLFLSLLFWLPIGKAGDPSTPAVITLVAVESCNLPAPENLTITNVTATTATGTWSAVPGAVSYLVEVRETLTNNLKYSNTTTNTVETATGLDPGTDYIMLVYPNCASGQSTNYAQSGFKTNIIIDLIAQGYSPNCPTNHFTGQLDYNNNPSLEVEIDFNLTYTVMVSQEGKSSRIYKNIFVLELANTFIGLPIKTYPVESEFQLGMLMGVIPNGNYWEAISIHSSEPEGPEYVEIKIFGNTSGYSAIGTLRLTAESLGITSSGIYDILVKECDRSTENTDRNHLIDQSQGSHKITVYPNPAFSNIEINLNRLNSDFCNISVLDRTGLCVLVKRDVAVKEDNLTIDISTWIPGVYFIQVETPNEVEIIKVVKME